LKSAIQRRRVTSERLPGAKAHDLNISFYVGGVAGAGRATPQAVELRHLRYFVAVAEVGNFTQAAERMFIAQPTLSQQIRRLEELVGAPLLHRGREGVRLTEAGGVLLEESRTVLSLIEHGMNRTRQAAGLGRPRLRFVVPPSLSADLAIDVASRLRRTAAAAGSRWTCLPTVPRVKAESARNDQAYHRLTYSFAEAGNVIPRTGGTGTQIRRPKAWICIGCAYRDPRRAAGISESRMLPAQLRGACEAVSGIPVKTGRAGYGTKIRPLGATGPMTATLPTAPVFRLIVPSELAG
jgi:hypothetical protein